MILDPDCMFSSATQSEHAPSSHHEENHVDICVGSSLHS